MALLFILIELLRELYSVMRCGWAVAPSFVIGVLRGKRDVTFSWLVAFAKGLV